MEGKDDIDYKASVNAFLRHYVRVLIEMFMESPGLLHFFSACKSEAALYGLCCHCLGHLWSCLSSFRPPTVNSAHVYFQTTKLLDFVTVHPLPMQHKLALDCHTCDPDWFGWLGSTRQQ